jgi:hypothetical protein
MPKLAALPGGAAINPEQVVYLRASADGAQGSGDDAPHTLLLRVQGFAQPIPMALLPNAAGAEAKLTECQEAIAEAGDSELVRLPRSLSVRSDEAVFLEVNPEKTPAGRVFVARLKIESDERPLELATFADGPSAIALSAACAEALGDDFVALDRGVAIRKRKVQRVEVRGDRKPDGSAVFLTVIKVQSLPRRLTLGRFGTEDEAIAAAKKAIAAVNEGTDEDEALCELPGGFAVRPDGLKGLRVRARRENNQVAYAVILLTDDDEEQGLATVADPARAEQLVADAVAMFNEAAASEWD